MDLTRYLVSVPLVNLLQQAQSATSLLTAPPKAERLYLLVPHISQNARASGDSLLLPTRSTGSCVVICRAALHICDFAEAGGVGLSVVIVMLASLFVECGYGSRYERTGRRVPLS